MERLNIQICYIWHTTHRPILITLVFNRFRHRTMVWISIYSIMIKVNTEFHGSFKRAGWDSVHSSSLILFDAYHFYGWVSPAAIIWIKYEKPLCWTMSELWLRISEELRTYHLRALLLGMINFHTFDSSLVGPGMSTIHEIMWRPLLEQSVWEHPNRAHKNPW